MYDLNPYTLTNSEPEPDIAIVKLPKNKYFQNHPTPQDIFWIIEISDTTLAYDLSKKKDIYAAANILEYWVLDVKNKSLTVFTKPHNNYYLDQLNLTEGLIKPVSFPDIAISVKNLFEE